MIPCGQKIQPQQQEQDMIGAQATTDEEEAMPLSNTLNQVAPREMPAAGMAGHSQSPQRASSSLAVSDQENGLKDALTLKVADLMQFMLHKYRVKEPTTKAEILETIVGNYQEYYTKIFREATKGVRLIFGIDVKEVEPAGHSYVLVTALGLTYDGMQSDVQGMPKTGVLIIALGIIALKGSAISEQEMWDMLNVMGVHAMDSHYIYGNPRKLITEEFVREGYLKYRQVPYRSPGHYEFLWGSRSYAETSKAIVLEFLRNISVLLDY